MHRRRFLSCLVALGGTPLAGGCSKRTPQLPKVDSAKTILAFGDSLTFGTGATPEESYPAVLEKLIGRRVVREGVPGEVTAAGLARLPEMLEAHEPQLVILCLGGNDLLQRADEKRAASNLREMIKLTRERGISVVLLAPPRPALMSSAPEFYLALAKEFSIPIEADILPKVLADQALKSDLVHPNARGYAEVAEALAKLLKASGAV